jgi:hypothetical protein
MALGGAVFLLAACSPAVSTVVVGPGPGDAVLVETTDELSPGDAVAIWHRVCSRTLASCARKLVARGIVTTTIADSPGHALVDLAPGARVYVGDRAVKEGSPMSPWHPDSPPQ